MRADPVRVTMPRLTSSQRDLAVLDNKRHEPARYAWLQHPLVGASALLTALTAMLTWPQVLYLGTKVASHNDPLLSMWRLAWIAHVLPRHPEQLVDGNIFAPHVRTLAYSDETLLEGLVAMPWLWAHVNPVLVYNVLLLAGIVLSGLAMFVLVQHLTGNADAALVAAAVFTLLPYRILHFMHLELQWTMWMPLTLWAVHRIFETGLLRYGALTGILLALQAISCLYYGAFLGIIVAVVSGGLAVLDLSRFRRLLVPLGVAAGLALAAVAIYTVPYIRNSSELGVRDPGEVANFSATLASYVTAPQENWLWGWTAFRFEGDELRLFPGLAAVALAALSFGLRRRRPLAAIYLAALAAAAALSFGFNSPVYRFLYAHFWPMQGFRAPARFGILAGCALAVLAGLGFEFLQQRMSGTRWRSVLLSGVLVAVGVECGSAPMRLDEVPRQVPDVYRFLRILDPSVVIELPISEGDFAPVYMYWSTHHWHRLVNGYSGFSPPDYPETLKRMRTFPDDASIALLRRLGVRFIVVHEAFYRPRDHSALLLRLGARAEIAPGGRYHDWAGPAQVFELKPHSGTACHSSTTAGTETAAGQPCS
jgi:hypothetical protein